MRAGRSVPRARIPVEGTCNQACRNGDYRVSTAESAQEEVGTEWETFGNLSVHLAIPRCENPVAGCGDRSGWPMGAVDLRRVGVVRGRNRGRDLLRLLQGSKPLPNGLRTPDAAPVQLRHLADRLRRENAVTHRHSQ